MLQVIAISLCALVIIAALLAAIPEMEDKTDLPESSFEL